MKDLFTEPRQQQILDEAKALIPDLDEKEAARVDFANKMRVREICEQTKVARQHNALELSAPAGAAFRRACAAGAWGDGGRRTTPRGLVLRLVRRA